LMTDRFVAAARSEGARICIDVNYRALLWDPPVAREVLASLLSHADVVICSERDARTVFEVEGDGLAAATSLAGRYAPGAELVVLTCASAGSVLVAGDAHIRQPAFPTRVVDRFGAGDAFTAGLLWGLLQGFEDGDALRAATALASLKCGILGDLARFGRSDVEAVMASLDGAAILR
jgi:2-dehydro-3-deoxygluconokinase